MALSPAKKKTKSSRPSVGWTSVRKRIARLAKLDRQRVAFGASNHRYVLNAPISERELVELENQLGGPLSPQLRELYKTLGNGGAGPFYGLFGASEIEAWRIASPFPGVAALKARFPNGVPSEELCGLVVVADQGCGVRVCVVNEGATEGSIVFVSMEGNVGAGPSSLRAFYSEWLEREIAAFEAVQEAMESRSYAAIATMLARRFQRYDAGDLIASLANVRRPEELFGTPEAMIFDGSLQFPWYRRVLKEWRRS